MRKYAQASRVALRLEREEQNLRLTVEDDGIGFDLEQVTPTAESGFGIKGMSERAHLLGGQLELCSTSGSGTRVVATVPAQRAPAR